MGYLHDGHLALMAEARRQAETLVVSIFVNPIQFNNADDLRRYPRDEAGDLAKCREAELWRRFICPKSRPCMRRTSARGSASARLGEPLCGRTRPGHFVGVTTVVSKLFNAVSPQLAVFGKKDYQQLAIIRRLVRDLDYPITIIGHPILRAADGLALSSRKRPPKPRGAGCGPFPAAGLGAGAGGLYGRRATQRHPVAHCSRCAGRRAPRKSWTIWSWSMPKHSKRRATRFHVRRFLAAAASFGGVRLIDNRELS